MGAYPTGSEITVTTVDAAIPEYWDAEALNGAYAAAVIGKPERITYKTSQGKKLGDTYHFIETAPFTTNAVGADGAVANQAITHTNRAVNLTNWREVTVTVTDRAKIQSILEYGEWAALNIGKALGQYMEDQLFALWSSAQAANQLGSVAAPEPLSDDLVLEGVINLDDIPVPEENRSWFFAPRAKWQLLKLDKFVDVSKTGIAKGPQVTGIMGELYGSPVFASPRVVNTGSPAIRKNMYVHQDAMALVVERTMNVEMLARVSKASTWSGDILFGVAVVRPDWLSTINSMA